MIISNSNTSFYGSFIQILRKFIHDIKLLPLAILSILLIAITACNGAGSQSGIQSSAENVKSILVTSANPNAPVGVLKKFTAIASYNDGSKKDVTEVVKWGTESKTIASVSNSSGSQGIVTSVAPGETVITASLGKVIGSSNFIVRDVKIESVSITPANPTMAKGTKQQFVATGIFSDGSKEDVTLSATWLSSVPAEVIDSSNANKGVVTALSAGTVAISANLHKVQSPKVILTVTNATLGSISLTPNNSTIPLGTTLQYNAMGMYSDGTTHDLTNTVVWTTSDATIASISSNGLLNPVSVGSNLVIATLGTITGNTSLSVTAAILISINITPGVATIATGASQQFAAIGMYSDGSLANITYLVSWLSSTGAVTFDAFGIATGITTIGSPSTISATYGAITSNLSSLTVTSANIWAYIANQSAGNAVSYCTINLAGSLSGCMSTGNGFANPNGVAVNNGYAYINNISNNSVSLCSVNPVLGSLSGCITTASGTPFAAPSQLVINNGFAFIDNIGNNTVVVCNVNPSTGALSACRDSGVGSIFNGPSGLAIKNGFAYIANQNSSIVTQCSVNPATGAFSGCVNSGATGLSGAFGFAIENGFAYIANQFSNTVSVCSVNPVTGALSGCGYTGIGFGNPKGIAIRNGFAYVTNQSGSNVISCIVDSNTGVLSSCNITGNGFINPVGIATN